MSTRRAVPPAAVLIGLVMIVFGGFGGAASRAESLDDRVYAVARQLLCPVCQGQTVAESDATVAREMRAIIRQKLIEGETPAQILNYFVGQFGEQVLAEPPRHGVSLVLYVGPAAGLLAGLLIAAGVIRRWTRRGSPAPAGGSSRASSPPVDPADLERLARELDARAR